MKCKYYLWCQDTYSDYLLPVKPKGKQTVEEAATKVFKDFAREENFQYSERSIKANLIEVASSTIFNVRTILKAMEDEGIEEIEKEHERFEREEYARLKEKFEKPS